MPFKSRAQIAKLAQLVKEGKLSQQKFNEFAAATKSINALPERVSKVNRKKTIGKIKKIK